MKRLSISNSKSKIKDWCLVTTSLEETWPENDQPILFLGEWCRLYSRKKRWEKIDSKVVPYHWDDRNKLSKDYHYLLKFFESVLKELVKELNNFHNVSYSLRYWRIIIGPWLLSFLTVIFDRWSCLNVAIEKHSIRETKILEKPDLNYVPQCMEHYAHIVTTDLWNHAIYSSILKYMKFENILKLKNKKIIPNWQTVSVGENKDIITKIKNIINIISLLFSKDKNYFFISTYLSKIDLIKLQLKLGQIPVFYQEQKNTKLIKLAKKRNITLLGLKCNNLFEDFAKEIIPLQIPKSYLEGYYNYLKCTNKTGWPDKPKLIWTSNSFHMDEIFKFWAAQKVEKGVPLVIGQHGGNYGQALLSMAEYHELKISDYYLSWGWSSDNHKVIPVGTFKKPFKNNKKKHLNCSMLFLISVTCRYVGGIQSFPLSSQWIDYLENQMEFYENFPEKILSHVTVRLYPHDYEWSQFQRWKDRFPNSKIDKCEKSINDAVANTNLVVSGWNTTAYLETMQSNIPTIIFWTPSYFEIRGDAKEHFQNLKKVGIFHDNPISAVNHIINIWEDIDSWWNQNDVTVARNEFTNKYSCSKNISEKLSCVFRDMSNKDISK